MEDIWYVWRHDESDSIGIIEKDQIHNNFSAFDDVDIDYTERTKEEAILEAKEQAKIHNLDFNQ